MEISERLKALRLQKKLTLQQLAKKSSVGIATLSRLENGSRKGTVRTHQKICDALDIELVDLFKGIASSDEGFEVLTTESDDIEAFVYDDKASSIILTQNVLRKKMLPALLTLEPGGETHKEQNPKGTEKFLFCLEGELEAVIDEKRFHLNSNKVLYFKSSNLHQFKNNGTEKVRCLCISTPAAL